jgi:hypothetical protein
MEVVCEEVGAPAQDTPTDVASTDVAPTDVASTDVAPTDVAPPKSRGRPKGAPNKVKPAPPTPPPTPEPKAKREKKEKVQERAASPPPFEPTLEELLGHMGRAMTQQRAVRTQARLDLYSQFLS